MNNQTSFQKPSLMLSFSLGIVTYLLFSFVIGFISIGVGYYVNYLPLTMIVVLALVPLILFLLLSFFSGKIKFLLLFSPVLWILGVFSPVIALRFVFVLLGIAFCLLSMLELFQGRKMHYIDAKYVLLSLLTIDQVIKVLNQGQYPLSRTMWISQLVVVLVTIVFLIILYDANNVLNSNVELFKAVETDKSNTWGVLSYYFSMLLCLFVFANNGVLSYGNNVDFSLSLFSVSIILCLLTIVVLMISKKISTGNIQLPVIGSVLLIISVYFYPWFDINVIFWFLGIISFSLIIQGNIQWFNGKSKKFLILTIALSFFLMVLLMYIVLLTEAYMLYTIMALLVLVGLLLSFFFRQKESPSMKELQTTPELTMNVLKKLTKLHSNQLHGLYVLVLVVLSLSAFLPNMATFNKPDFPATGVRAMTFNLHFAQNNDGFDNIEQVIGLISTVGPSFIAFEEVMFNGPINGYGNMFGRLKSYLEPMGYKYSYHTANTPTFLTNAFFSIYPIVNASTINLLPKDLLFRTALNIVIEISVNKYLRVVPVHLTSAIEDESNPDRVAQGQVILDAIDDLNSSIPTIILGDFNSFPDWPETNLFSSRYQDAWDVTHPGENGYSWPSFRQADQRIDYIFVDQKLPITACKLGDNLPISDHNYLTCDINY